MILAPSVASAVDIITPPPPPLRASLGRKESWLPSLLTSGSFIFCLIPWCLLSSGQLSHCHTLKYLGWCLFSWGNLERIEHQACLEFCQQDEEAENSDRSTGICLSSFSLYFFCSHLPFLPIFFYFLFNKDGTNIKQFSATCYFHRDSLGYCR